MINNLKKVISSAAVVAMVASSASAFAVTFPDVDESASYAGAVQTLTALGIVNGDDNGLFNPDNNVTRAEFAKMVVEALGEGSVAEATTTSSFTDAANTTQHWAAGYIATGVSEGWINGYGDGTFGPDDSVTYAQAVKMLVSAIGYETYATTAGGWPSGYLSYGNTLDIIDGVTVSSNDTELTRAQCAILIANTLKAPVVEYGDMTYGGITGTVPIQSLVQMNGTGDGWQTLLTRKHNAYVVKGRVDATSKTNDGLSNDEVSYIVEAAENFDGEYYSGTTTTITVKVNDTDAANMLFEYTEAIIQKDKDSGEYSFVSIEQYGANRTASFDADLFESYTAASGSTKASLNVYKSSSSSSTTSYKLDANAEMYINGVDVGLVSDNLDYLLDSNGNTNAVGQVTLIDKTEEGSTSTDGYYDYVTFDYYVDAVVDSVSTTSTEVRVYFKQADSLVSQSRLTWDPDDDDVTVTFLKDDVEIDYTDLAEYDVVSIAYNVTASFSNSNFYEVQVSQNTVSGSVSSMNSQDNTITVDGSEYDMYTSLYGDVSSTFDFNTDYTLYLDAFGRIAYFEEGSASKNYGVVVAMYMTAGSNYPTVRLLTTTGSEVTYEVKDSSAANDFWEVATGVSTYGQLPDGSTATQVTKSQIDSYVGIQNAVVTYRLSSGKLVLNEHITPRNSNSELVYNASTGKLGSYVIDDSATTILAIDGYMSDEDSSANVITSSSLVDDGTYTVYLYDKSSNTGAYRFILLTDGLTTITPDTQIAVVSSYTSRVSSDGTEYISIPVLKDGEETTVLYDDTGASFSQGDIIIYTTKSDGTISQVYTAVSMGNYTTYSSLLNGTMNLASDGVLDFTDMINDEVKNTDSTKPGTWKWTSSNKESNAYFGPIYQKNGNNLEVIVGATTESISDGDYLITDLNDTTQIETFSVAGDVNSYVYDYSYNAGKAERVYIGSISSSSKSIYNVANYTLSVSGGEDIDYILWSGTGSENTVLSEDIRPNYAFVRTVDDDVTEVVYFFAN